MNSNGNGNYDHYDHQRQIVDLDDDDDDDSPSLMAPRVATTSYPSTPEVVNGYGVNYIEHRVSKMDTLAGVAIKYGIEVSDIRKMNSLVTDLQMFALKTLHIPLLGKHSPSPSLSNGSKSSGQCSNEKTTPSRGYPDLLDSFQSLKVNSSNKQKVSPAMSTLQGFYALKSTEHKRNLSEGLEMSCFKKDDDGHFPKHLLTANPPLSRHRKSKSAANGFFSGNNSLDDDFDSVEDMLKRGRKPDYFGYRTPEILLKEDPSSVTGGFSAMKGKGLALRSKGTIRNSTTTGSGASVITNLQSGVRKSSSTSCLQDQESCSSSLWPLSKWNLKTDLQALSAATVTRPMFDGLPKPIPGVKNKAALD